MRRRLAVNWFGTGWGRAWPVALALAVGVAVPSVTAEWARSRLVVVAAVFFALTAAPFAISRLRARRVDIGAPIYLVAIWYALAFPARALYVRYGGHAVVPLGPWYYGNRIEPALELGLIGFLGILVGYYSRIGPLAAARVRLPDREFVRSGALVRAAVVSCVGLVAWLYLLIVVHRAHGQVDALNFTASEGTIVQLSSFLLFGLSAAAIALMGRRNSAPKRLLVSALFALPVVWLALRAVQRYTLFLGILSLALAYNYRRRPISAKAAAILGALVLLVGFPLLGAARTVAESSSTAGGTSARTSAAFHELFSSGWGEYRKLTLDVVLNRMHGVDSVAGVLNAPPKRRSLAMGRPYVLAVPLALVPRALWPGKPRVLDEQQFGSTYFGSSDTSTRVAIYNVTDLLLNFGMIGVVVGGLLLGFAYRAFYEIWIVHARRTELTVLVYSAVLPFVIAVEWTLSSIIFNCVKVLPGLVIVGVVMCAELGPSRRQTSEVVASDSVVLY